MTKALQTMEWMTPGSNLNAYIQGAAAVPILSVDEEKLDKKNLVLLKELLEKFREIENEKSNPSIKKFFQKAKSFWKN